MALIMMEDLQRDLESSVTLLVQRSTSRKYSLAEFRGICGPGCGTSETVIRYGNMMQRNTAVEVGEWLLDLCGYQGATLFHKKGDFKRFLIANNIVFVEDHQGEQKTVIFITPRYFARALMLMTHPNSIRIRELHWEYMTLMHAYSAYEAKFNDLAIQGVNQTLINIREQAERALNQARQEAEEAEKVRRRAEARAVKANEALRRTEQHVEDHAELVQSCFDTMKSVTLAWESTVPNTTIQPEKRKLRSVLAMFLIQENRGNRRAVYTTRCQHHRLTLVVKQLRRKYPDASITELVTFDPEANGTNLFLRVKAFFRGSTMGVTISQNTIHLGDSVTAREFRDLVVQLRNKNAEGAEEAKKQLEKRHDDYVRLKAKKA